MTDKRGWASVTLWAKRGWIVATSCLVVVLGLWVAAARARIDRVLGCPSINVSHEEVPAPGFCEDPTRVALGRRAAFQLELQKYADGITFLPAKGDGATDLLPINVGSRVKGAIAPARGAENLTRADLVRRGRIVARITSNGPYAHGIPYGVSYVWVDYHAFVDKGWRVLILPASPTMPIAVLSDYRVDETPPPAGGATHVTSRGALVDLDGYPTPEDWQATLSDGVRVCLADKKGACWVNPSTRALFGVTSGWVQVTGTGCVCVGTDCHNYN